MPRDLFEDVSIQEKSGGRDLFADAGIEVEPDVRSWWAKQWDEWQNRELSPEEVAEKKRMEDPIGSLVEHWKNLYQGGKDVVKGGAEYIGGLPKKAGESFEQIQRDPGRAALNVGAGATEALKGLINLPAFTAEQVLKQGGGKAGKFLSEIPRNLQIGDTGLQEAILGEQQVGDEALQLLGNLVPVGAPGAVTKPLRGLVKGAETAVDAAKPSSFLRGQLPISELQDNLRLVEGTNTGLGQVLDNPQLARFQENVLTSVPFSGATSALQKTKKQLTQKGHNLLEDLRGGAIPENLGSSMQEALKDAAAKVEKKKNQLYGNLNRRANELGIEIGRENLGQTALDLLEDVKQSPELARTVSKELLDDLKFMSDNQGLTQNLKLSNIYKGKLGDKAYDAYVRGDKYEYQLYKDLKKALDKDIEGALSSSSDKELSGLRKEANDYYKTDVAAFEEPEVVKFTRKGGDPDELLSTFLKTSRTSDRSNLLNKIMSKLPEEDKKLVPYAYYSRAMKEGELDPAKLRTLYKQLGDNQRKVLFEGTGLQDEFRDYIKLLDKNNAALNVGLNPPTGQKLLELATLGLAGQFGHLGKAGGAALGANLLNRYLTSPQAREKLIKKMIENEGRKPTLRKAPSRTAIGAGLAQEKINNDDKY